MIDNFALIIGSAKSGTSSLFSYLAEHPEIAACSRKEAQFFSNSEFFAQGFEYYQSLWNWNDKQHKIALEATPNYTRVTNQHLANAAQNIADIKAQTGAKFKFIYLMRDPIDRIESHYTHLEAWGQEPNAKPYAEGLSEEIIDVSKYAMQLEEYYQRFATEDILLLNFDELKDTPAQLMKQVCEFLEVDSTYQFNGLSTIYNDKTARKNIFIPGWTSIRKTDLVISLAKATPNSIKTIFRNVFGSKITKKIELSLGEKEYVLNQLQDDLQQLTLQYGVDTNNWRKST